MCVPAALSKQECMAPQPGSAGGTYSNTRETGLWRDAQCWDRMVEASEGQIPKGILEEVVHVQLRVVTRPHLPGHQTDVETDVLWQNKSFDSTFVHILYLNPL